MLVSIIIPTFNAENFIIDTLNQLTADLGDYDVIIVDDGSSDQTVNLVQEYCRDHKTAPIKLVQQKNQGVSVARNTGMKVADGEFLVFCDADDILQNGIIEVINQYKEKADVILWRYSVLQNGTETVPQETVLQEEMNGIQAFTQYLYKDCYVRMGSFAVKKELLEDNEIIFTPDCRFAEDLEFIFKMLYCSTKVQYNKEIYYQYVKRTGSAIYSYNIRRFDAPLAIERVIDYIKKNSQKPSTQQEINIKEEHDLKKELDFLEGEFYLKQYFYSLDSCLQYLTLKDYCGFVHAYKKAYTGLDQKVQNKVRQVTFHKIDYSAKRIKLMKVSIRFYMIAMLLNHTIKGSGEKV